MDWAPMRQPFSSPRMWDRGNARISDADAARFRARRAELKLGPLVIHANYLINLASPSPVLRTRSVQAFHQELVRAAALGADDSFTFFPSGSGLGSGSEAAISAIAQSLKHAARGLKLGEMKILLENTAGHGGSVGSTFEELKAILDACPDLPLGICIDTAHTFAAGWDIRSGEGLEGTLRDIDGTVGLDRVAILHVHIPRRCLDHASIGTNTLERAGSDLRG